MSTNRDWTYYQYDTVSGPPLNYFRYMGGITDRLDQQTRRWVSLDSDRISRYLERGEVGLDEITRAGIESAIGLPLPD